MNGKTVLLASGTAVAILAIVYAAGGFEGSTKARLDAQDSRIDGIERTLSDIKSDIRDIRNHLMPPGRPR